MDLRRIIEEIAGRADDFLAGASDRKEARVGIAELITSGYSQLSPLDRRTVTEGVIAILEEEGFFQTSGGEASWDEPGDGLREEP